MKHIWIRSEQRINEKRTGITPSGAAVLLKKGFNVTIEESANRIIATGEYEKAGCTVVRENSWHKAPKDAIIFGLKELPEADTPLIHNHIMFGHAFKGQHSSRAFLKRFKNGKGSLFDLEYLVDEKDRRVAAFGYWAGYLGAAISLKCWIAQQSGAICGSLRPYANKGDMILDLQTNLETISVELPSFMVIGALGRVGKGALDLCEALNIKATKWDLEDTSHGGPFVEILQHELLLNCIIARPGSPVFFSAECAKKQRKLAVIGDIACDPDSDYNPIPIYKTPTNWRNPAIRIVAKPVLDLMAIDNLPSLLPLESSEDFAAQLLPYLIDLDNLRTGVWGRAKTTFDNHMKGV